MGPHHILEESAGCTELITPGTVNPTSKKVEMKAKYDEKVLKCELAKAKELNGILQIIEVLHELGYPK